MTVTPRAWLLLPCLAAYIPLAAETPRERYQPIIDAKPFGDIANLSPDALAALQEEQQQKEEIAKKFRMCGITDMPDGSRKIAFIDETDGQPASYILGIGETQNGFTLLAADYEAERATLSKDGLTFTLGLGKGLIEDTPPAEADAATPTVLRPQRLGATPPPPAAKGSFRERLLKREAAKAQAETARREAARKIIAAETAKAVEAQTEAAARRLQIERIKQGLPPTRPITLTAEEDAELEAAGVFRQPAPAANTQTPARQQPAAQPENRPAENDSQDPDHDALSPADP